MHCVDVFWRTVYITQNKLYTICSMSYETNVYNSKDYREMINYNHETLALSHLTASLKVYNYSVFHECSSQFTYFCFFCTFDYTTLDTLCARFFCMLYAICCLIEV